MRCAGTALPRRHCWNGFSVIKGIGVEIDFYLDRLSCQHYISQQLSPGSDAGLIPPDEDPEATDRESEPERIPSDDDASATMAANSLLPKNENPWIFQPVHGWINCRSRSADDICFWTPDMGWIWTRDFVFPALFRAQDKSWLWYQLGSAKPRWFFNFRTKSWESRARIDKAGI